MSLSHFVNFHFRCAGYICQKVGKVAASAVGGGLLLLQVSLGVSRHQHMRGFTFHNLDLTLHKWFSSLVQIANNSGYVQVDWKRVEKDVNKAKKQLKTGTDKAGPELNSLVGKVCPHVFNTLVFITVKLGRDGKTYKILTDWENRGH